MAGVTDPLFVGVGAGVGAVCRYLVSERVERATLDTLVVNTLGSFLLGVVVTLPVGDAATLAAGTGFCGAFTTFSSFAFETVRLAEDGFVYQSVRNAVGTLAFALVAVLTGSWVGSVLLELA